MKKLVVLLLGCLPVLTFAAGGGYNEHVEKAAVNLQDRVSLQNGAQIFVNNCMGCHGLEYQRYGRTAQDLGIPVDLAQTYLNFTTNAVGDRMASAMSQESGAAWFGVAPPDLSNITHWRSADWLYSYLINFYPDESRPFGHNNRVFENVAMPHVLADMEADLGEAEFRAAMLDLTNFLHYVSEPVRLERERLGVKVLVFLFLLLIPAYLLKKEYWKDIH